MIGVFIAYSPGFQCASSDQKNQSLTNTSFWVSYEECHMKIYSNGSIRHELKSVQGCSKYVYVLEKHSTIVTEFDLVCDQAKLAELIQAVLMAGQIVGAVFVSPICDRMGRKTVHLSCNLLTLTIGISAAFAPNYTTLVILKFVLGVLQQGMVMSGVVLTLEVFPERTRFQGAIWGAFVTASGLVVMTGIAYLLQNSSWRYLQITLSCFSLLSLIQYWVQDESLRWLIVNGKMKRVKKILLKVAKWNKLDYEDLMQNVKHKMTTVRNGKEETNETLLKNENTHYKVEKYSIKTILQTRSIRLITFLMCFIWVTDNLTYFGLTLMATSLAGNRFLNFFFSAFVEYVSLTLNFIMLHRLGRLSTLIVFHSVAGISLTLATFLNYFSDGDSSLTALSIVATLAGKMSMTGSISVLYLFTPELFPTNIRNVGMGMCSTFARVGALISSFAGTLARHTPWAPGAVFSVMCFVVIVIVLYLPETRGMDLPQTLEEVKIWYAENSGIRVQKYKRKKANQESKTIVVPYNKN